MLVSKFEIGRLNSNRLYLGHWICLNAYLETKFKRNIFYLKIIFLTIVNNIIILMHLQADLFYYLSNS